MTACVACETALCDYQENVSTGQTHGQRPQTNVPLCFAGDTKTTTLEKKKRLLKWSLDTPSSAGIYSVPTHCIHIYTW